MGDDVALFDGGMKIYVRERVQARRALCQDLSPSTVHPSHLHFHMQVTACL